MSVYQREYSDLDHALDDLRSTLGNWAEQRTDGDPPAETIHHARLVLQEWVANLHRHAHFKNRTPAIRVCLRVEGEDLHGLVTDNSEGFDFQDQLSSGPPDTEGLPEGGMGLQIIDACTDELSYTAQEDGRYHFAFSIPDDHDPWLSTPF